ncbi:hypothetical protein E4U39_007270 [Claviceps sp. Clav50 group G5]|nr:hypothetical protein E4U39_007270 [Claviceps sp. Clav50 group G5]
MLIDVIDAIDVAAVSDDDVHEIPSSSSSTTQITPLLYNRLRPAVKMATSRRILITSENTGLWQAEQDEETAAKVTELLQQDFEKHHVFFNARGFHNHITHHLLTLYGLGAPISALKTAYDANEHYQQKAIPVKHSVVTELQRNWSANAPNYLSVGKHYSDFLAFFQLEIDEKGWEAVLSEFVFQDTSKSRDIYQRLFSGIAHPLIQLQFGLEWEQPAIIAAALAQAAVHDNSLGNFFDEVDAAVEAHDQSGAEVPHRYLSRVCEEISSSDSPLRNAAEWKDSDSLFEGVLGKTLKEAVQLAASLRVKEQDVDERTAEMLHHNAYVSAASSQYPPHVPRYDFFLIHSLNASLFFLSLDKPFIPVSGRIRLLEHKMRYDMLQYIARGCPLIRMSTIRECNTHVKQEAKLPVDLLPTLQNIVDDGHVVKVVRSLLLAEETSSEWEGSRWMRLSSVEDWLQAHRMLLRGVQGQNDKWIYGAGFPSAWKDVPLLSDSEESSDDSDD